MNLKENKDSQQMKIQSMIVSVNISLWINKTSVYLIGKINSVSLLNPLFTLLSNQADRDTELKDYFGNKPVLIVVCIDEKRNLVDAYTNILEW